jgi:predicted DNA-binding transcriptional regulator YafY
MARSGRLLGLYQLLSGRRALTVREIADRMEVSLRTAYRDIAELEASRIPLECTGRGFRVLETAAVPPLQLTPKEHAVLRLALSNPVFDRQSSLIKILRSIQAKLGVMGPVAALPKPAIELAAIDRSGRMAELVLESLERAIDARRACEIVYESLSDGRSRRRKIDPYRIWSRGDAWYVAAYCHERLAARIFRLDRIDEVIILPDSFSLPENFDLEAFLAGAWTVSKGDGDFEIRILFASSVRPLIARARHHASERVTELEDGSCDYRARVSQLDEIARWVVGFGPDAKVLEPTALCTEVQRLAQGALTSNRQPRPPRKESRPCDRN